MSLNRIIVLDFGSQYTHLLARRIRESGVYSDIMPPDSSTQELMNCKGIILSGGPKSVYAEDAPKFNKSLFSIGKPILGVCYGHQLMAFELKGKVVPGKTKEYGKAELELKKQSKLFAGIMNHSTVWMSHGDEVTQIPDGFTIIGSTKDTEIAAMANEGKRLYSIQFHPEVTHTEQGMKILSNFIFGICGCQKNWSMENFLERKVNYLKEKIQSKKIFLLASGGVDSSVCALLLSKTIDPKNLHCIHVDSGLMREKESMKVMDSLKKLGIKVDILNSEKEFMDSLHEIDDPEQKRKIIGELFVELAEKELEKLAGKNKSEWLIAQGTIYPDTIETGGTKHADKIKTHHNRVDLMQELIAEGRVIEPINELYKDEVRELGMLLGLPKELVARHPFPGPGLAIRILCGKKFDEKKLLELSESEKKINEFLEKENYSYSAKMLPIRAVGVQGDERTYRLAVALSGEHEFKKMELISTDLTNKFREINRVLLALNPLKINSIESIEAHLTIERIELLRKADDIVNDFLKEKGIYDEIWQFPVVLAPVKVNEKEGEAIILRPVTSLEAMTARFAWMNNKHLNELSAKLMKLNGEINAVFYDCTNKPPATIEWE